MSDSDEYTRLGGPEPDTTHGPMAPRSAEAEDILRKALAGVPRIHVAAELRAEAKRVIDKADMLGLLELGAPDDEYDPEIDHIAALATIGCLTADSAWAVFVHWFLAGAVDRIDPRFAAIARIQA